MAVYKDKKRNTWYASVRFRDWTGKSRKTTKRGFATKREAQTYEVEFLASVSGDMDMSLSTFVDVYYKDKKGELKERTLYNKKHMISKHVIPYLGDKPMNQITPADIIDWQNAIKANNSFSEAYLRMLQNQVTALFTHAQKIYNLKNNPCARVKKMGRSDGRSMLFWTYEEYKSFREYEQDLKSWKEEIASGKGRESSLMQPEKKSVRDELKRLTQSVKQRPVIKKNRDQLIR